MAEPSRDVSWREYDIQDQDSDEDAAAGFFLQPETDELQDFEFKVSSSTSLKLTFQETYTQSTGMSIWRGSEVLAKYLKQNPEVVKDKTVLELGAGVGLVGLTAHHLGASRMLWTDGDEKVLENLRKNVKRNTEGVASAESQCPQLIWGKDLDHFREEHGCSQVILGTDLFYMKQSLAPLFQTVDELLAEDGIFMAVMVSSAQSPISTVFEVAHNHGFQWISWLFVDRDDDILSDGSTVHTHEHDDERIYVFARK
jgi:predicted nicotinamide N-methyase